jgi:hypothetical protein
MSKSVKVLPLFSAHSRASGNPVQFSLYWRSFSLDPRFRGDERIIARNIVFATLALIVVAMPAFAQANKTSKQNLGIGREATAAEISGWDIDVRPDAQSLSNDELYAVVAYLLYLNDIVDDKFVLSKDAWIKVKMPNEGGFFEDDRDKTERAFWQPNPCMSNCGPAVTIKGRARMLDVTPDDKKPGRGID